MMEDRKLSEKESLELISRMIQETQESKARYEAYPLLIWGYTTIVISLCIWYGMTSLGCSWQINFLWFALPVISTPASLYFNRKNPKRGVRNYMDRITTYIWSLFGAVVVVLGISAFFTPMKILFMVALLMSMATTLSGAVSKFKPLVCCGIVGVVLSFVLLFVSMPHSILIFGAIFAVMMVIPGHILNRKMKELC
ncbi:putative uncharacterized protein [Parabacteroides sp. CAG:409]|nr:hypothetical protein [Parabacteroides sp.]MCI7706713.1 hypothetical protein [Parabacteroides sp.]MDY5622058.1 hypothetical protein [Bacteroidales bacterium]CDE63466.1 putative uncharacterized protein [Parabacteroides sp. CAG:409]